MNPEIISFAGYLKGKDISPLVKRCLNFLFVGSISSFLFTHVYYDYTLIDVSDYKGYYNYFIQGYFFIPFAIFFLVWMLSEFLGFISFKLVNFYYSLRIKKAVIWVSWNDAVSSSTPSQQQKAIVRLQPLDEDGHKLISFFNLIVASLDLVDQQKLRKAMSQLQDELERDFVLLFRALLATLVFFPVVPHFGWLFLLVAIASILIYAFLLFIGYQVAEIAPVFLAKTIEELKKVLADFRGQYRTSDSYETEAQVVPESKP